MKTIFWVCRNCQLKVKLLVDQSEAPFTAEGGIVEGYCEPCFDAYQEGGLEAFEKRTRQPVEPVPHTQGCST